MRILNAVCVPMSAVGCEATIVGRSDSGTLCRVETSAGDVLLLAPAEFELIPETESTGEPVPPTGGPAGNPEEAASPPAVASSGPLEHVAYLRAAGRAAEIELTLAKVATDLQSISTAIDVTLAGANHGGLVLARGDRLAALVDAATAVLADPTPDNLSALRRALAQKVVS